MLCSGRGARLRPPSKSWEPARHGTPFSSTTRRISMSRRKRSSGAAPRNQAKRMSQRTTDLVWRWKRGTGVLPTPAPMPRRSWAEFLLEAGCTEFAAAQESEARALGEKQREKHVG